MSTRLIIIELTTLLVVSTFLPEDPPMVIDDYLIVRNETCKKVDQRQDIHANVIFPETECRKTISYVEIIAAQSREYGHAELVHGGIGKCYISIEVVARDAKYLTLTVAIYGR
ncbi:uncharacterized protein LOC119657411 isoform X2 [Hermetia illucens]|uniref:uncharacterized protein LOC119657411 isoform X2 n=1 Tax=Hermetia illucens TaxID=343691 RepID=UPI0018CC4A66|nr:uncharacterized protein LOC119657411 isoform X2 [Hermetia illucens]